MKKSSVSINIGLVAIIIEMVLNVIGMNMELPTWCEYVKLIMLAITIVCIILYFVFSHKEKKEEGN